MNVLVVMIRLSATYEHQGDSSSDLPPWSTQPYYVTDDVLFRFSVSNMTLLHGMG